jgi:SAM-dependent methyltransferase
MDFVWPDGLEELNQNLWFESEYFPIYYSDKGNKEVQHFVRKIQGILRFKNGEHGIDICCGTGRFSVELNKLGLEILGIDLSKLQIQQALAFESATLKFQVADIESFVDKCKFDYAFIFFSSFGYKNDATNVKILNNIHQMLKPNGTLVLDYWNASNEKYTDRLNSGSERVSEKTIGETTFTVMSKVTKECYLKKIFLNYHGITQTFWERIMVIDIDTFQSYFERCGYEIVKVYGDYNLTPYNRVSSNRIIFFVNRI